MILPSNKEVAAVLRGLFGERVLLLGPPDLVAEEVLRTVRLAISRSEINRQYQAEVDSVNRTTDAEIARDALAATQEQPARFNGEQALAEWEDKHGGGK